MLSASLPNPCTGWTREFTVHHHAMGAVQSSLNVLKSNALLMKSHAVRGDYHPFALTFFGKLCHTYLAATHAGFPGHLFFIKKVSDLKIVESAFEG